MVPICAKHHEYFKTICGYYLNLPILAFVTKISQLKQLKKITFMPLSKDAAEQSVGNLH